MELKKTAEEIALEALETAQKALYEAERAKAYYEIQKVWAAHGYCYRAQQQRYELENFWAKDVPDIMYAHGEYGHSGRGLVTDYYARDNEEMNKAKLEIISELFPDKVKNTEEYLGVGDLVIRMQTSSYIEIAKDNKTAKGIFYTFNVDCEVNREGMPVASAAIVKDCVDFIKESGGWKIWHYRDYVDFGFPISSETMLPDKEKAGRTVELHNTPGNKFLEDFPEPGTPYMPTKVAKLSPELPKPYDTWSDDLSYAKPATNQNRQFPIGPGPRNDE